MDWKCKFCGFDIQDREDRRRIRVKDSSVYIIGFCDNCHNWTILYQIPIEKMREHIKGNIN